MNKYIQVFCAIIIVIILFIGSMVVYNQEMVKAIRQTGTIKKTVPIFNGVIDFGINSDIQYDTLNPNAANYVNMGNSINQVSGAEYSYNFWLYVDNTAKSPNNIFSPSKDATNTAQVFADAGLVASDNDPKSLPFVLFLRGSNRVLEYQNQCSTSTTPKKKVDVLVKSPLVKLEDGGDILTVEFNTLNNPDGVLSGSRNTCEDIDTDWKAINQYKIGLKNISTEFPAQWFMITITLQDTLPSDPFPIRDKIRTRIYTNGVLKLDKYIVGKLGDPTNVSLSPLRISQGNVYVNPTLRKSDNSTGPPLSLSRVVNTNMKKNQIMMADLTYYNYALASQDITGLFGAQFNKKYAPLMGGDSQVAQQSIFDKLSVNYDPKVKQINNL
jgi:hypothetical protein